MREQYREITISEAEKYIPAKVIEQVEKDADRLLGKILNLINYAGDIRMVNAEGVRVSLARLQSDEQAKAIFLHLLQEDPIHGILLGTKVKPGEVSGIEVSGMAEGLAETVPDTGMAESVPDTGLPLQRLKSAKKRPPETLYNYVRRMQHLKIPAETLREIGCRLEIAADEADPRTHGRSAYSARARRQRENINYLVGGIAARPSELGWAAVFAYLARKVASNTKILHACAARYQLKPVEEMLNLYDSISSTSLSHIPDLFHEARKLRRHFVIHVGGTNTGKTHDAMAALANAPSGVYLCPLRMLAYEGRTVIQGYGVPCSFATGEEKEIDPEATHISETIGMLDFDRRYDMAVIDECQLISGEDGSLYTNAILGVAAPVVQVCCAWSGLDITRRLIELCGDDYEQIDHHRASELKFEEEPYRGPRKNDAYIVFSRLGAYEMAAWLEKHGMHPSIVYGKLPYEVKMEEARKFESGDTDCLVATDAIAIGQNYNIERIVFRDIVKHINRQEVRLDSQTVKQVAGRAGRFGRFPVGYVNTFEAGDRDEIRTKLEVPDTPSATAPLELPSFLVDMNLPLSLIYKAWTEAECGAPFVKADTSVEMYICKLIESRFHGISKRDEYSLASLPLDLKDKDQQSLLEKLLSTYNQEKTDARYHAEAGAETGARHHAETGADESGAEAGARYHAGAGARYRRADVAAGGAGYPEPASTGIGDEIGARYHASGTWHQMTGQGVDTHMTASMPAESSDDAYKCLLPDKTMIHKIVKYRPHMMTLEKLCRQLDLASSFFYKIRRDDLATYTIRLKPPLTRRIAQIMAEKPVASLSDTASTVITSPITSPVPGTVGEGITAGKLSGTDTVAPLQVSGTAGDVITNGQVPAGKVPGTLGKVPGTSEEGSVKPAASHPPIEDTSAWPTAYIYVSASGQTERNTGRFPYGDYSRLYSRELRQSYGNEATYIDYYCYKRKTRTPDYCHFEPYYRYTVKLDPRYIVSDEGAYYLAERFKVIKCDYLHTASPMRLDRPDNSRSHHYRNNRHYH